MPLLLRKFTISLKNIRNLFEVPTYDRLWSRLFHLIAWRLAVSQNSLQRFPVNPSFFDYFPLTLALNQHLSPDFDPPLLQLEKQGVSITPVTDYGCILWSAALFDRRLHVI